MPLVPTEYTGPGPDDDMGGRGYDPSMGPYDQYKAGRKAYKSTYQPGGWRHDRNERENLAIAAAGPMGDADWHSFLGSMGIHNVKDQRQSRYKSLSMARDGGLLLDTNYHLTPEGFMDVATSDVDPASPTGKFRLQSYASNPDIAGQARNGFYRQMEGDLGFGTAERWQRQGETGMPKDPATGLYVQRNPDGSVAYYDERMYRVDPSTRRRTGHYMFPGVTLGSFARRRR